MRRRVFFASSVEPSSRPQAERGESGGVVPELGTLDAWRSEATKWLNALSWMSRLAESNGSGYALCGCSDRVRVAGSAAS